VLTGSIVGGLVAASVPVLALELSHARQMKKEREAPRASARRTSVMPIASALPSGGWVGIAGTL
ncbi:MAG: hypothetical protein JWN48_347, partial [Myxococcaceae bacterium]|nr:hypothetical protein [Myxococcaceae bacterium]